MSDRIVSAGIVGVRLHWLEDARLVNDIGWDMLGIAYVDYVSWRVAG